MLCLGGSGPRLAYFLIWPALVAKLRSISVLSTPLPLPPPMERYFVPCSKAAGGPAANAAPTSPQPEKAMPKAAPAGPEENADQLCESAPRGAAVVSPTARGLDPGGFDWDERTVSVRGGLHSVRPRR